MTPLLPQISPNICGIFFYILMMLGAKDAERIVPYSALPQSCPIFGYRGAYAPLLSSTSITYDPAWIHIPDCPGYFCTQDE